MISDDLQLRISQDPRVLESRKILEEPARTGSQTKVKSISLKTRRKLMIHLQRDILTRQSFLNAIVIVNILGGSTNAVYIIFLYALETHSQSCRYYIYWLWLGQQTLKWVTETRSKVCSSFFPWSLISMISKPFRKKHHSSPTSSHQVCSFTNLPSSHRFVAMHR